MSTEPSGAPPFPPFRLRPYWLALAAILALGYATLSAWLPAPVLLLVAFAAIFWLFSFVFALVATLRRKSRAK
jgi:hypothetical protein